MRHASTSDCRRLLALVPPASSLQPTAFSASSAARTLGALPSIVSRIAADAPADNLPDWAPKPKPNVVEDRFRVEVLLLGAGFDTLLRVDESLTDPGTVISAEDDLGLDDSQLLPQAEITLLPGERHLVRLSGLSSHRSANTIIDKEIEFDDEVYLPGERVDSELNLTMFGLRTAIAFFVRRSRRAHGDVRHPDRRSGSERRRAQPRGSRMRKAASRRCR